MEIRDFKEVRVGQSFPHCFDIKLIEGHESYGVYAQVHNPKPEDRLELRRNKYGDVALFTFKYSDLKLPKEWEDSEILWENK